MRHFLWVIVAAMLMAAPDSTKAGVIYEQFDYPFGQLSGDNGGTGFSGSWVGASDFVVAPGALNYPGLAQVGNRAEFVPDNGAASNVTRTIQTLGTAGSTVWLSFLLQIDGNVPDITADFRLNPGANYSPYIYMGRIRDNDNYWGVLDSGLSANSILSNVPIVAGVPVFIAVEIDLNANPGLNDNVNIYFDPTPGAAPNVTPIQLTNEKFNLSNVVLGLDGAGISTRTNDATASYDPIRMGSTYESVAPLANADAPEPATLCLVFVGLSGLIVRARRVANGV